jgi:hypothetical protein
MSLRGFNEVTHTHNSCAHRLLFETQHCTTIQVLLELLFNPRRDFDLMLVITKYNGLILRSSIGTLSIERGGVMNAEKISNQILKVSLWISQFHEQYLNVS